MLQEKKKSGRENPSDVRKKSSLKPRTAEVEANMLSSADGMLGPQLSLAVLEAKDLMSTRVKAFAPHENMSCNHKARKGYLLHGKKLKTKTNYIFWTIDAKEYPEQCPGKKYPIKVYNSFGKIITKIQISHKNHSEASDSPRVPDSIKTNIILEWHFHKPGHIGLPR